MSDMRPQPCRVIAPSGETFIAECIRAQHEQNGYYVIAYREQLPQSLVDQLDKVQPMFTKVRLYTPAEQVHILSLRPKRLI